MNAQLLTPFKTVTIQGRIHLTLPLVAATIAIYDDRKRLVETFERATDHYGYFSLRLARPLKALTLVVSGGSHAWLAFDGELRADVDTHTDKNTVILVNPVTTIASLYRAERPRLSISACLGSVRNYLGVPAAMNCSSDLQAAPRQAPYSAAAFVSAAAKHGGVNAYAALLARSVDEYSRITDGTSSGAVRYCY